MNRHIDEAMVDIIDRNENDEHNQRSGDEHQRSPIHEMNTVKNDNIANSRQDERQQHQPRTRRWTHASIADAEKNTVKNDDMTVEHH
jgi:hypothetical protein